MIEDTPIVELVADGIHVKFYANGKVEGFDGIVINRLPQLTANIFKAIGESVKGLGDDIINCGDMTNGKINN